MSGSHTDLRQAFEQAGQGHVFRFWDQLDESQQSNLLSEAAEIDLEEINRLSDTLVMGGQEESFDSDGLEPAPYRAHPSNGGDAALWQRAREVGEEALRGGKVAAFVVAGGQGTRLGYNAPKGTFPVTPVSQKSLFQVFAEKIRAAEIRYETQIPWLIMTSNANYEATVEAFEQADYFGLKKENVRFFRQGRLPAVDGKGKILLEDKDSIAMSPDGHGGSLRALVRSGAIAEMKKRGVSTISYFQVDNPLVHCIDPTFVGFHLMEGSAEMSSKMIPKAYSTEKVGHFCTQNGQTKVIEYSDMPESLQEAKDAEGKLRFIAGSIAIHVISVDFVEKMGGDNSDLNLPFHLAHKKINHVDEAGKSVSPQKPNGYKFEMFVFDALPFASDPVIIETRREDEFSPVKNAEGLDSPKTCSEDQLRQFTRWTLAAGLDLATDVTGLPAIRFEVSPLFADSEAAFVEKWNSLEVKPEITDGTVLS
ncbi:MAG: UDPGP type 1 family protein [Opitutales bacterium]|nr:UDPGP type 1 family protein [Opitutales bacterium]